MTLFDIDSVRVRIQRKVRTLLRELQALPFADEIEVFGSAARGGGLPGDLDIMMHFTTSEAFSAHPAGETLLRIARKYRDTLDPFVKVGRGLWVRHEFSHCWVHAQRVREIYANFRAERMPLVGLKLPRLIPLTACFGAAQETGMQLTAELLIQQQYAIRRTQGSPLPSYHKTENGDSIGVFENGRWHIVAGKLITGDGDWMANPGQARVAGGPYLADTLKWVPVPFDPAWTAPATIEGTLYV